MSTLYCILTVLPSALKAINALDSLPSKKLLLNLHRFFSTAFWWPTPNNDGVKAWNFVHGSRINSYHRSLQVLASNFIKSADRFIRSFPHLACHIDRPNMHRILELAYHTIPLYNHIRFICELVFESSHQPLKFYLSRNHSLNSHIYAVQLVLAKDWMVRLWSLWTLYRDNSESKAHKHYAFTGLLRLLFGEEVDKVNWRSPIFSEQLEELRAHVHDLMMGTVESRLDKRYGDARMTYNSNYKWVLYKPPRNFTFTSKQDAFFTKTRKKLAELCMCKEESLYVANKALLDRGFGSASKSSHERLLLGDIIQVLVNRGFGTKTFLSPYISDNGTPHFFVVGAFFGTESGPSWAVVRQCTLTSPSSISQLPDCAKEPIVEVTTRDFYQSHCASADATDTRYHFLTLTRRRLLEVNYNMKQIGRSLIAIRNGTPPGFHLPGFVIRGY